LPSAPIGAARGGSGLTSSLKELEPIKAIRLTAKLAGFLERWH
jgi:hypothetical protein